MAVNLAAQQLTLDWLRISVEVSTPVGRLTWSSRPDHLPHNESLSAIAVTPFHQSVPGTSKCCSLVQHDITKAQGPNTRCATHRDLSPALEFSNTVLSARSVLLSLW